MNNTAQLFMPLRLITDYEEAVVTLADVSDVALWIFLDGMRGARFFPGPWIPCGNLGWHRVAGVTNRGAVHFEYAPDGWPECLVRP